MKYGPHEQYTRHVDFYDRDSRFFGNDVTKFGGQRVMTALLYLTTCGGGETVFRKAKNSTVGLESCAKRCAQTQTPHAHPNPGCPLRSELACLGNALA